MKTVNHSLRSADMRTFGGRILLLVVAGGSLVSCPRATSLPQLNIADAPVSRENHPELSFAPVVKKVSPSVVNIYTAKTVRENPGAYRSIYGGYYSHYVGGK